MEILISLDQDTLEDLFHWIHAHLNLNLIEFCCKLCNENLSTPLVVYKLQKQFLQTRMSGQTGI